MLKKSRYNAQIYSMIIDWWQNIAKTKYMDAYNFDVPIDDAIIQITGTYMTKNLVIINGNQINMFRVLCTINIVNARHM